MGLFDKLLKGAAAAPAAPAELPTDLKELRRLRDRYPMAKAFPYARKLCEVGVELYRQGKLVADPGDPYDVGKVIDDIYQLVKESDDYPEVRLEPAFQLQLLEAGEAMTQDFNDRKNADPTVRFEMPVDFSLYAWEHLPGFYAEGKYCQRNAAAARKYLRMLMTLQVKSQKEIGYGLIEKLMEVIAPGEAGKQEILKWITMDYGLEKLKVATGQQKLVFRPYELFEATQTFFQLNTDIIGNGTVEEMLAEYVRGAKAGNAYAQYKLGRFYHYGYYVEQDYVMAEHYLLPAAQQRMYLGLNELTWVYSNLRSDWDRPKKERAEYGRKYEAWVKLCDPAHREIQTKYASAFSGSFDGAADNITYGCAAPQQAPAPAADVPEDEEYRGRYGKDEESPFTLLQWPNTITGPHGVKYYLQYVSTNTADYRADTGEFTTLHLSDRGAMSARNSDGYFWW